MESTYDFDLETSWHYGYHGPGEPYTARRERSWADPCPKCGTEVTGIHGVSETVVINEQSVISVPNPACPYDEDDPHTPDCICTAVVNPCPDPIFNTYRQMPAAYYLKPCGHAVATFRIYTESRAEPGTLGALYEEWSKTDG